MGRRRKRTLNELALVRFFSRQLRTHRQRVLKGVGDDAAVLPFRGNTYLLYTSDMLIENRHFTCSDKLSHVGRKALNCSVSDIVAMGGVPRYALISIGIPRRMRTRDVTALYRGLQQSARMHEVEIVGGDTNASTELLIDVSMIGTVAHRNLVLRSGATAQDYVFVTGRLGGSIYHQRHLLFTPRLREMKFLQRQVLLHAMIDVTDGLLLDTWRILSASKVGAILFEEMIPVHAHARSVNEALSMGEDFELLFTVSKKDGQKLLALMHKKKIPFPLSCIGMTTPNSGRMYMLQRGCKKITRLQPHGFLHFS